MAKIGWVPRRDWGTFLKIEGKRLDGPGTFRTRHRRALSPRFYPSGVTLPSVGCWQLTLRTAGRRWIVVVQAIEPPATPSCDQTPVEARPHPLDPFFTRWIAADPPSSRITASFSISIDGIAGAAIHAGGRAPNGASTKVLWMIEDWTPSRRRIDIFGQQVDGPGTTRQGFPETESGAGLFPSNVVLPSAGCWVVRLRIGHIGGVVVFRAVAP